MTTEQIIQASIAYAILLCIWYIEASYDFGSWFGIIGENEAHKWAVKCRILKETFDWLIMPIFIVILQRQLNMNYAVLTAYVIGKWWHICDSIYNIFERIATGKHANIWGDWRWWTPLGLLRCNWWGHCLLKGYTKLDMDYHFGHWSPTGYYLQLEYSDYPEFSVGIVSLKETWYMAGIGLILSAVILVCGL